MANLISQAIGEIKSAGSSTLAGGTGDSKGTSIDHSSDNSNADVEVVGDSSSTFAHDSEDETRADENTDAESAESDESTTDSEATGEPDKAADAKTTGDRETITITDDNGRRKVEIDYSDRAATRKAHEMAAGARKFQVERDREKAARAKVEESYARDRKVLDALEKAFADRGEEGVIDLIAGREGASAEYIQKKIDRAKFLEKASPEEKAQLEQRERIDALERELARNKLDSEEREKRITSEREATELRATEATVHPVFEKYRFDGKLGDDDAEEMFDTMLWNSALTRLKPYEEQGLPLTKELVDREFKAVASKLRQKLSVQAEKKAAKVVEQKKQEATENAQASTHAAYKRSNMVEDRNNMLAKGDFAGFIRSLGGNKRK